MPLALQLPKIGDGFVLRALTREDAADLANIEFDPDVKRFLALPKKGKAEWIDAFDPETYDGWAIQVENCLAGRASILRCRRRGEGELAIVIARSFWGQHLGRKVAEMLIHAAFDELRAIALMAKVHPEHRASISLLREFRFRRRGVVDSSEHGQEGYFIYRLSRTTYNLSLRGAHRLSPVRP